MTPKTINPNAIKVRDRAMLALIRGATKGGAHEDRKREANRRECRRPVRREEW